MSDKDHRENAETFYLAALGCGYGSKRGDTCLLRSIAASLLVITELLETTPMPRYILGEGSEVTVDETDG